MFYILLLYSFIVLSSCSELQDKVFRNLVRLCPEQFVPTDNSTAVNHTSESASCCTDYFNQSPDRMFYSNSTNYLEDGQSCLYPSTNPDKSSYNTMKSYYMVTKAPRDGCVLSDNRTAGLSNLYTQATCNDSEIIPIRRFLPVYSKPSGFIYKNPQCAYCHGHYELSEWKTKASCYLVSPFEYDHCQFQFIYTGPVNDIHHLECFTDTFNSCPNNFTDDVIIPTTVDISPSELAEACSMDHLPRFEHKAFWKNVFCYICHDFRSYTSWPFTECFRQDGGGGRLIGSFIRTLDWSVLEQNMRIRNQDKHICGLGAHVQICHDVLCPQGQLMTEDEEGMECQMDSTRWVADKTKFTIWLLLYFNHNIENNESALEEVFTRDHVQSPWQAYWTVVNFYRPFARNIDMAYANGKNNMSNVQKVDSFSHAYVQISCKKNSVNPATFVRRIEQTLRKMWYFKIANTIYRARQSFSRSTLWNTDKGFKEHGNVLMYVVPTWHLSPNIQSHERILYKAVVYSDMQRDTLHIKKSMFCRQVELAATHFKVFMFDGRPVALLYNRTGKFLFDNEFTSRITETDDDLPKYMYLSYRICISDTEKNSASKSRGRSRNDHQLFVLVLFMLLLQPFRARTW